MKRDVDWIFYHAKLTLKWRQILQLNLVLIPSCQNSTGICIPFKLGRYWFCLSIILKLKYTFYISIVFRIQYSIYFVKSVMCSIDCNLENWNSIVVISWALYAILYFKKQVIILKDILLTMAIKSILKHADIYNFYIFLRHVCFLCDSTNMSYTYPLYLRRSCCKMPISITRLFCIRIKL